MARSTLLQVLLLVAMGTSSRSSAVARQLLQQDQGGLGGNVPPSEGASGSGPPPTSSSSLTDYFVEIVDGEFVLGCNQFPVSGWNEWEVMEKGAGAPRLTGSVLPEGVSGPESVVAQMDEAVEAGFTVVRTWAHGVSSRYPVLLAPGQYNEGMLRGLDFAVDEARKRGLKLILSFTSNWTPTGGVDDFAAMTGVGHNDFFTHGPTKELYKDYVQTIVTRTNTINGRTYSEDPTIMAWNLINEPVCRGCPPGHYRKGSPPGCPGDSKGTIAAWVREMAGFVKGLDPNHLLTVGEEGFWSTTSASLAFNPGYGESDWAVEWNQDFVQDHTSPDIDFTAIHIWPDQWKCQECSAPLPVEFVQRWIRQHMEDSRALGKPLLIEEFGKENDGSRDAYFEAVYQEVEDSLASGGVLKGSLFWQWYGPGETASVGEGGGSGRFGVYTSDRLFSQIGANAATTRQLYSAPALRCTQKAPAPPGPCTDTFVGGRPGTGFEGPGCDVDINECARGTASCHPNAVCENSAGGYQCVCPPGAQGDGVGSCSPDQAALDEALASFWNVPSGLACDPGIDIPFPTNVTGWLEDPTGFYERNNFTAGGLGARTPVSAQQCAVACLEASGCETFSYNEVLQQCFLKASQCPLRNDCQGPEQVCESESDTGDKIQVPCGSWTTFYSVGIPKAGPAAEAYCASLPAEATVQSFGGGATDGGGR